MLTVIDPNNSEQFNESNFSHVDHFEWERNPEIKIRICYPKAGSGKEVMIMLTGSMGSILMPISELDMLRPV